MAPALRRIRLLCNCSLPLPNDLPSATVALLHSRLTFLRQVFSATLASLAGWVW